MNFVNFDNSATTFPKPPSVAAAVQTAFTRYGGNPGRGGHKLSVATSEQVFKTRSAAAEMFGAQPQDTVFAANCTAALNMAIKGMMQYGGHIIISDYEHNSVFRPVYALYKRRGATFSVAQISDSDEETVENFRRLIRSDTKCICCMAASNVTGRLMPIRELAELCRSYGICFITDAAQAAGLIDLKVGGGVSFICASGHKALYGPSGTGLLISSGEYELSTIMEGGTGATSEQPEQTPFLPERLESGTVNTAGIIGLRAGLEFVKTKTPQRILAHEISLCEQFEQGISRIKDVKLYRIDRRAPIVSFNIGEKNSQRVSAALSEKGFALRGGLHCAPLAHRTLGTLEQGTVRFSPAAFNNSRQVDSLIQAVAKTAKEL